MLMAYIKKICFARKFFLIGL